MEIVVGFRNREIRAASKSSSMKLQSLSLATSLQGRAVVCSMCTRTTGGACANRANADRILFVSWLENSPASVGAVGLVGDSSACNYEAGRGQNPAKSHC